MAIQKNFSNSTLTLEFAGETSLIFSLKNCSYPMRDRLALHGAIQMTEAKANQSGDCESAFYLAEDTIAYIYEQYPTPLSIKTPRNELIEAIARIKGYSIQDTSERWNRLSLDERAKLALNDRVKYQVAVIRGERAVLRLEQLDDEINETPHTLYEHDFDLENRKAHIRFINGRQLEIDLALVKDVNALALYGAQQKISDSYSGIKNEQEKRSAAERIIHNLNAGMWTSKKEAAGQDAFISALDTQVVNQLVEWMRWPAHATIIAVSHIDEEYKLRLLSGQAKVLLSKASQMLGPHKDPSKYNQREISDLLDEVIDRFV